MSGQPTAEPELTPRAREIVAAARELLEAEGEPALSMRRVAAAVGIRAPSLYKHLPDKEALEAALISDGLADWAVISAEAIAGEGNPLAAVAFAYRAFANSHPHLYRLMTGRPLPRQQLRPGVEAGAAAPLIEAAGGDPDTARAVWGFAHGMAILELNERYPPEADLDAAWRRGIEAFGSG